MVKKRKDCYILRIQQSHHYPWAYCRYYAKLSPSFFTINLWTTPGNMPSHYLWIYCWFVKTLLQRVELIILPSVWLTFIIIKVNSFIIFFIILLLLSLQTPFNWFIYPFLLHIPFPSLHFTENCFIVFICVFCLDVVLQSV